MIQRRDETALAALADVRVVWDTAAMPTPEQPTRRSTLELEFLPNPYFANAVLRKHFTFHAPGGSLTKLGVESAQVEPIEWQPNRDLTQRTVAGRTRQADSFFALFSAAQGSLCRAFGISGQSRAAQAEAVQVRVSLRAPGAQCSRIHPTRDTAAA
ncbi:hypothetical protein TSOC_001951 [Tetrabaena socialis]|uniref:Uncharacterized protein n=1 Tax=Tetrabaena socialis TaxID=47790 RepID=A0A2J8AFE6_9CHLO|nr:hypothetical protein TSOC_001951 [Tetrabaena socialis]|eukprot:PNH11243.1 hypothetical protein TSOC_001951 [Tetrabaena socialis]